MKKQLLSEVFKIDEADEPTDASWMGPDWSKIRSSFDFLGIKHKQINKPEEWFKAIETVMLDVSSGIGKLVGRGSRLKGQSPEIAPLMEKINRMRKLMQEIQADASKAAYGKGDPDRDPRAQPGGTRGT